MEHNNIDFSKMEHTVNKTYQQMAEAAKAKAEYQAALEGAVLETRDLLHQMRKDSEKESNFNRRTTYILITIALLTLTATIVFGLNFLWL
jgi:glycerol kinase